MVHAVEKAITAANLGLNPQTEGQVIRLRIPELNEERRKELVKVAHKYAEAARVAVRHVRRDGIDVIKKLEKDHQISRTITSAIRTIFRRRPINDPRHRPDARQQGKGNPDGLTAGPERIQPMSMPKVSLDGTSGFEIPRHVAIIMDGNGRWAAARGLPRGEGHRRGVEALRRTVRAAGEIGIDILTIFAFSAENWSRPQAEIRDLHRACCACSSATTSPSCNSNNVRVRVIGERETLSPDVRRLLEEAEDTDARAMTA